jgi:hypothetical protein
MSHMLNECIPLKTPAEKVTVQATGAVTGKRFCKISAPRVGGGIAGGTSVVTTSGPGYGANTLSTDVIDTYQVIQCSVSGEAALGVAQWDLTTGQVGGAFKLGVGHVLPITCGANITAGTEVQTDATGKAIPLASGKALGYALDSALSGADCEIALY